jgi:hypothetical protein
MPLDHAISKAIRAHDDSLSKSYFEHRQTVNQIQHTLLTQIFPNVLDELGLTERARDWAQEWLHDDRTFNLLLLLALVFIYI